MSDVLPDDSELTPIDDALPPDEELTPIEEPADPVPARLKLAHSVGVQQPEEQALKTFTVSRTLGVPYAAAAVDPQGWDKAFAQANFDPTAWAAQNPELTQVALENPDLAPMLVTKEKGPLTKLINFLKNLGQDPELVGKREFTTPEGYAYPGQAQTPEQFAAQSQRTKEEYDAAVAQREGAIVRTEFADNQTRLLAGSSDVRDQALVLALRAREAARGIDVSAKAYELMMARQAGADTSALERDLADLEAQARPGAYGEGPLGQALADVLQGGVSTVDVLKSAAREGGTMAVLGGLGGAIAGGVVSKTPAGALAGFEKGAMAGAQLGGGWGTAQRSYVLEAGSTYQELGSVQTDAGEPLTENERAGAAMIAGSIKAGLEVLEVRALLRTLGPAKVLLEEGGVEKMKSMLASDPSFRALAAKAAVQLAKSVTEEGAEEAAQEATDQAARYLVASKHDKALQQGDVFNEQALTEAAGKGALGAVGLGVVGTALNLGASAIATNKAKVAEKQTSAILEAAADPVVQAAPDVFAQMIADTTAKTGEPVTHLYVKGEALQRYFQGANDEAKAQAEAALGPDAQTRVAEAVATGGSVAVPLEHALSPSFAGSELAKAVLPDTTTKPGFATPRELAAGADKQIEQDAKAIADAELAREAEKQAFTRELATLKEQLIEAGRTKKQATSEVAVLAHAYETLASGLGVKPEELLAKYRVSFGKGDNAAVNVQPGVVTQPGQEGNPAASLELSRIFHDQSPEDRQRAFFIDTTTGALNKRAFDRLDPAGRQVASIGVEGVKYTNDSLGHDAGNSVYRAAAQALAPLAPEVAKVGGDFALYVTDQAELDALLEQANANPVLGGHRLTGAVGANLKAANEAHGEAKKAAEKAGSRAQRGQRPLGAVSSAPVALAAQKLEGTRISDQLLAEHAKLSPQDAFTETYTEPSTGLLTKDGFDALPRKKFVASIDLNGLKELNEAFGEVFGDFLLLMFGNQLRALGGEKFDAAHISGDEYAAQHDDEATLKEWLANVEHQLESVKTALLLGPEDLKALNIQGSDAVLVGLPFGYGVGETVDNAEHELNAHKQRLLEAGKRGEGAARRRIVAAVEGSPESAPGSLSAEGQVVHDRGSDLLPERGRQRFLDQETVAASRLHAVDPENPTGAPRGYTELPPGQNPMMEKAFRVFLNENADASTVIHESAHVFLEILGDLAEQPDAPERVRQHYADALAALGVEKRSDIKREHHETFARGFEAYLFEGKAPTPKLEGLFTRFSLWLKGVYRSLTSLNVEVSPQLRSVFDRLLATDEEIARAQTKHGPPLFNSPEAAGVTNEQWLEQQQADDKLIAANTQRAQLYALKDRLRETEKWWKDELRKQTKHFEAAYEELPARRAQKLLMGEAVDGVKGEPLVLQRARVERVIGNLRVPGLKTSTDESEVTNADEVAALAGFPTSDVMIAALAGLRSKDRWVAEQAHARMAELHPSVLDDRTRLRALVEDGLSKYTSDRILREDADLRRRADNGATAPAVDALRRAAELIAQKRTLDNLNASAVLGAERSAAVNKARAAAKGDWTKALEFGRQQLLNSFLHRELLQARERRDDFRKLISRLQKEPAQARLGKASPAYRDAVNFILEAVGAREPVKGESLDSGAIDRGVAAMEQLGAGLGDWLLTIRGILAKGPNALTVSDMGIIQGALKNFEIAAREQNQAILDGKRVEKDVVIEELIAEATENKRHQGALSSSEKATTLRKLLSELPASISGMLLKPEVMVDWLGGELKGKDPLKSTSWRAIFEPLHDARIKAADLTKEVIEPIVKAFEAVPPNVRKRFTEAIDGARLFPTHGVRSGQLIDAPDTRFQLLMMALNFGNASNADRLLRGRNITQEQVVNALNLLTKEEIDVINAIWATNEKLKQVAFDLEERMTGLRPVGFEPTPVKLQNGTLTGGYVPATYDRRVARAGEAQASSLDDQIGAPRYGVAATARGHLKSRTDDFYDAITLDPDVLMKSIYQTIHDAAFREPIRSVAGLLFDDRYNKVLRERLGISRAKNLERWVQDVAVTRGIEGADIASRVVSAFRTLKGNAVANALMFSAPNFIEDFSNLPAALAATKLKSRHLLAGLVEMAANPVSTWKSIESRSPTMRAANEERLRDLTHHIRSLWSPGFRRVPWVGGLLEKISRHGFITAEWSYKLTATPVWLGMHRQALEDGESEEQAVKLADAAVRRVFPSNNAVDQAGLNRDRGFLGAMLLFDGFLATARNVFFNEAQRLAEGDSKGKREAVGRLAGYLIAVTVISAFLRGRGPDDDDESWAGWAGRTLLTGVFEIGIPASGDVVKSTEASLRHKHFTLRPSLASGLAINAVNALLTIADEDKEPIQKAEAALRALGPLAPQPIAQPLRMGKFVVRATEEQNGLADWASGFFYGESDNQGLNGFRLFSEKATVPPLLPP